MPHAYGIPNLGRIEITDPLFGWYTALVAETIIPYQWEVLNDRAPNAEKSYCIRNFHVAAGALQEERCGAVFQDTDLYKWLETVAYCIENGSGKRFESLADEAIALIESAQQADGYLNTYYSVTCPQQKWTNLTEGHELYSAGYLIEAAVAYYAATGKDRLLRIAQRFADLIDEEFGAEEGKRKGYPGHQEIELALVKLYRVTGQKRYLRLAQFFIAQRGRQPNYLLQEIARREDAGIYPEFQNYDVKYSQAHLPPVEQTTAEGHAVRATYMYSAMADLAAEGSDEALACACKKIYENMTEKRMFVTGGIGSSGVLERFTVDYDLPNDRAYCETCASIGLMMFGQRMTQLMRHASYFDGVERALYNTVLGGISKTGDRYFYVNPLEVWPDALLPNTSMAHVKGERQPWFTVACCPPNIARTLASLGRYIYAVDGESLCVHLYISSVYHAEEKHEQIGLVMDSTLIENGKVRIAVRTTTPKRAVLRLRVPAYAEHPVFALDGQVVSVPVENGYAVLDRMWADGAMIDIDMGICAHFVAANDHVWQDVGKIAAVKGPVVYCLEQEDNGHNLATVYVSPSATLAEKEPVSGLPGQWPTLAVSGHRLQNRGVSSGDLYGTPDFVKVPTVCTLIPYALWANRTPGEMLVWMKADV